MTRSPDSLVPSGGGQPSAEKRDDEASSSRQGGEANPRAATQVNAVSASSTPPASTPAQLERFPGRAGLPTAKPATGRSAASDTPSRRDGVEGGGTRRQSTEATGETLLGRIGARAAPTRRGANKGSPRNRRLDVERGVGGGRSTEELRDNRGEGRAAASTVRSKQGKAAGLHPRGSASSRPKSAAKRMDKVRKLQRALYRADERPR
jgi:hypothetical protein